MTGSERLDVLFFQIDNIYQRIHCGSMSKCSEIQLKTGEAKTYLNLIRVIIRKHENTDKHAVPLAEQQLEV